MSNIDILATLCENECMEQQNISLTPELLAHAKAMVASGRFANVSDYMRALIREDQDRARQQQLERMLLDGLESGDPVVMDEADWNEIRETARVRFEASQKKRA
ncbi:MAG: type II toxin-antitoxin system ParD family antitoxin [Planctomycetota bacterium]